MRAGRGTSSLRVAFADYLAGTDLTVDPIARRLLNAGTQLHDDVTTADLVLYSVFGSKHTTARGTRLAWNPEPWLAQDPKPHWTLDWRYGGTDHHHRLPFWAKALLGQDDWNDPSPEPAEPTRFCNFIYSNPRCGMRNAFFEMLNKREPVDALGAVAHNTDHPTLDARRHATWWLSKRAVLRDYRFTIAFESEEHVGYTTEKLTDAWLADSIPIYWGNPAVALDFPEGSYLSLYEAGSMTRLTEMVLEAHHDPARYEQLRSANPLRSGYLGELVAAQGRDLSAFLDRVLDDARAHQGKPRGSVVSSLRARQKLATSDLRDAVRRRLKMN